MDNFVTIKKPFLRDVLDDDDKQQVNRQPPWHHQQNQSDVPESPLTRKKLSSSALTKHLLNTLHDKSNPITHHDIGLRTEFFISMSTGHQINDSGRHRKKYSEDRNSKLADQRHQLRKALITASTEDKDERKVLDRVRIYINGYLDNMTDIEMKRIVVEAGGHVMATAAGATHILTSQQLSASKTHRILTTKSRHQVHVVKPEWVVDSIKAGKRRPEREYAVIQVASTRRLPEMFRK